MAIFKCTPQPAALAKSEEADIHIHKQDIAIELSDEYNWTMTETVTKEILTYNGKKSNSELKISYNPVWQDIKINYARVTTPSKEKDGKPVIKEISVQEINLMDEGWVASAPRYPAGKTLVASLPGVEIGSLIDYQITTVCKNQHFFAFAVNFKGSNPIRRRQVTISAPTHINLQTAVYQNGFLAPDKDAHQNNIVEFVKTENGRKRRPPEQHRGIRQDGKRPQHLEMESNRPAHDRQGRRTPPVHLLPPVRPDIHR